MLGMQNVKKVKDMIRKLARNHLMVEKNNPQTLISWMAIRPVFTRKNAGPLPGTVNNKIAKGDTLQ